MKRCTSLALRRQTVLALGLMAMGLQALPRNFPDNALVMSGALVDQELVANYTLNGGQGREVWLLDAREAALKRPRTGDLKN